MTEIELKNKLLKRVKHGCWSDLFNQFYKTDNGKKFFRNLLVDIKGSKNVFPRLNMVFRAFNIVPINDVKVVLLGTRPFRSIAANGLCFGLSVNVPIYSGNPLSTNRITDNLESNISDKHYFLLDQSFRHMADQGVLMLNGALTSSEKGGHMNSWGWFIIHVLKYLDKDGDIVFAGIGDYPKKMLTKFIKNSVLLTTHDTTVVSKQKDWISDLFTDINENLKEPIIWH